MDGEALLMTLRSPRVFSVMVRHHARVVERGGDAALVRRLSLDGEALLKKRRSPRVISLGVCHPPCCVERLGSHARERGFCYGEQSRHPSAPLAHVAAYVPESRDGAREAETELGVGRWAFG